MHRLGCVVCSEAAKVLLDQVKKPSTSEVQCMNQEGAIQPERHSMQKNASNGTEISLKVDRPNSKIKMVFKTASRLVAS